MTSRVPSILVVEDSPEDYEVVIRTLRTLGIANPVFRCEDGDDALDFLHRRGRYAAGGLAAPRPSLVLLDLNLPGTDGRTILRELKATRALASIPVVVLTTSSHDRDVDECYRAGANSYITKSGDLDRYRETLRALVAYWFEVAVLPNGDGGGGTT